MSDPRKPDISGWTLVPRYTDIAGVAADPHDVRLRGRPFWSMAPVNEDNSPIPGPVTFYKPVRPSRWTRLWHRLGDTNDH